MANLYNIFCLVIFSIVLAMAFHSTSMVEGNFVKNMHINWGSHHSSFLRAGKDATLVLDQNCGSGIESKRSFLFGSIEMLIKLVPGNSAGTVTAYYLSSRGEKHDEIDFEFLGNVSGQPYVIHTNIYTQGGGGREQQFYPWFDPTADYHNYTILWSPSQVVWYVDSIPIRVYRNYVREGMPYPNRQAMRVYASIWNGDSWATRGGLEKIDWEHAPFVAKLRNFRARVWRQTRYDKSSAYSGYLSYEEQADLKWVRNNYMIYDYCYDSELFHGLMPGECFKPQLY